MPIVPIVNVDVPCNIPCIEGCEVNIAMLLACKARILSRCCLRRRKKYIPKVNEAIAKAAPIPPATYTTFVFVLFWTLGVDNTEGFELMVELTIVVIELDETALLLLLAMNEVEMLVLVVVAAGESVAVVVTG